MNLRAGSASITELVSGLATLRLIPGATALTIRDSANTLDAATFNAAGTLLTLNQALTMAGAFTNNAGSTSNALTNTTTGAINATFRYDASNRLDLSVSSVGSVTLDPAGTGRNLALFAAGSFGGGVDTVFIANAATVPSTDPTGGGILYVEGGALKYRGTAGTITTLGPA